MLFALRQEFIPCAAPLNVHLLFSISTDVLQDEPSLSYVNAALLSSSDITQSRYSGKDAKTHQPAPAE